MADRDIIIDPYELPGGPAARVSVRITATDPAGKPIDVYRIADDSGVVGTRTISLGTDAVTVSLPPNTDLRPPSAWKLEVLNFGRRVRRAIVQMEAGDPMSFADMLDLPSPGDFVLTGLERIAVVTELPLTQVSGTLYFVMP